MPYVHVHITNVVSIPRRVMLVLVLVQVLHRVKVLREWIIIVEDESWTLQHISERIVDRSELHDEGDSLKLDGNLHS